MTIEFHCVHCGRLLKVKDNKTGRRAPCPHCGNPVTVPGDREDELIRSAGSPSSSPFHSGREPLKPGKVQAISIMMLIGGILALIQAFALVVSSFGFCLFYPGIYYALVLGIMAIVRGSSLLGAGAHLNHPPRGIASARPRMRLRL